MTQYGDLRRLGYFDSNKTDTERAKILDDYERSLTQPQADKPTAKPKTTRRTTKKR